MEEITQQFIKSVDIDSNSRTIVLKTSGNRTLGISLDEYLKNNFEKKIIKLIEPSNNNDPFIILDNRDYGVWRY